MKISNIGIIGAGTMGSGISQVAALTGYDIVMQDVSEDATNRGIGAIDKSLQRLVDREKITADAKDAAIGKIRTTTDLSGLADCDLVIEAATAHIPSIKDHIITNRNICAQPNESDNEPPLPPWAEDMSKNNDWTPQPDANGISGGLEGFYPLAVLAAVKFTVECDNCGDPNQ